MKAIYVIIDGLGDRPIKQLGGKTPLEHAKTPNMDRLAKEGICGIHDPIAPGIPPGSDTAHLSLFGLDPHTEYHGRGPLEVKGLNMELKHGDIAFRANCATVDENLVVKDRRAGRIDSTEPFCKELDGTVIDGVEVILKPGVWYRAGLVLRGDGLSDQVSKSDPKKVGEKVLEVKPLDDSPEAKKTADVLNKFTQIAYSKLNDLEINKKRIKEGKLPANMILFRGAGRYVPIPTLKEKYGFRSACIAGGGLYKGIGSFLGMDVIEVAGATGKYDSDFSAKTKKARKLLESDYDFIFIHMKATDSAGEDGNVEKKVEMLERMDEAIGYLLDFNGLLIVTGDHSTPCELKHHSGDPVPLLMRGPGIRTDVVESFGERVCATGGLGRIKGLDVMNIIASQLDIAKLYGA